MGKLMRAALAGMCVLGAGLVVTPLASAEPQQGCRYYYTSWGQGPNGETTGFGEYQEGDIDPEGRVCQNGWWVTQTPDESESWLQPNWQEQGWQNPWEDEGR
ncbi:hypothetical protein GCM10011581_22790 [Saccharopolyspora subtropica]|uniref:Secreted protein n=1 Tax=Saccharopolyspora thermophila TaxID=89367 RepID=A0A917JT22_9PSEU|nr:hypothetical protein [Saccharopolyspora subtropica]GGI85135.1 hypothetical protein GCM10011581_22790 [Saccharopolyspora subtropica]